MRAVNRLWQQEMDFRIRREEILLRDPDAIVSGRVRVLETVAEKLHIQREKCGKSVY